MTKKEFLQGVPFRLGHIDYRYVSGSMPGAPESGCIQEWDIFGLWVYAGAVDVVEKWGVTVCRYWLGKEVKRAILYKNLELSPVGLPGPGEGFNGRGPFGFI